MAISESGSFNNARSNMRRSMGGKSMSGADLSHTVTISFDLPDGVFLTSAAGATFGDVRSTGAVPEPSLLLPLGLGLACLVWGASQISVPA